SGKEALESTAQQAPDLILLDVMMPDMDGYAIARMLKANPVTLHIPIIMVTASVGRDARMEGLNAGAEEFLLKPVDRSELWLRVRNLLRLKSLADFQKNHNLILEQQVKARSADLQRFRAAMEISGDAIVLVDRTSMRYIDVNQTLCDLVGRSRPEVLAMSPMELFGTEREVLERDYDAIIANRNASEGRTEGVYRHRNGSLIPIETRRRALHTESGWIIVATARDITERKQAEEALRRFSLAMDATADAIYLVDRSSMRFVHVNDAACRMQGRTREEMQALGPGGVLGVSRAELEATYDAIIVGGVEAKPLEMQRSRAGGLQVWVEIRRHAQRSGDKWTIVTLVRDITERKAAETKIRRLNRVYAVLSGINTLIVRVRDRNELYREACRIAVEDGGFRMAWIGIADREAMRLTLVAREGGVQDYVDLLPLSLNESDGGKFGLSGIAVLGRKPVMVQDLELDPRVILHKESGEHGLHSLAMLPLIVSDQAVAVLALYANEIGFFDEDEMKLLRELAGDISFAIHNLDKQDRADYLAYYDVLTGLANRRLFLERLSQYVRSAAAAGHKLAVFLVDLERFKNINDSLGQTAGDALLQQVAEWIKRMSGDAGLVARLGADHFAVVLPEVKQDAGVARLVEKTQTAFHEHPFHLGDSVFRITAKVGIAMYPDDAADADILLKNAEAALKKAKASGDKFLFYTQEMTEKVAGRLTLENQLRQALDREEFVLHFQPKVNLATAGVTGAEALIRWNHPQRGLVPPGHFIPILEETGLINEVGRWALRQAITTYLRWCDAGLAAVRIAVNVSPMQLRNRGFIAEIASRTGVDPRAAA